VNIVLLTHPSFLGLTSQDRFAAMLCAGLQARGATVTLRRPAALLRRFWPRPGTQGVVSRLAGYVDQYLVFPWVLAAQAAADPPDALYVLCDQALGPWLPLLTHRPHVVHCHDFIALRAALGEWPGREPKAAGRLLQRAIRRGLRGTRHAVSVSQATRADLHRIGGARPFTSEVVLNPVAPAFRRLPPDAAWARLQAVGLPRTALPPVLHLGSGAWYKNSAGAVALYAEYAAARHAAGQPIAPLWLRTPASVAAEIAKLPLPPGAAWRCLPPLDDGALAAMYSVAGVLLFPSHAEGFGWPIAEALACGCAVLTSDAAPMNEVAGPQAHWLPLLAPTADAAARRAWAAAGGRRLAALLADPETVSAAAIAERLRSARRFDADTVFDALLAVYRRVAAAEAQRRQTVVRA
jgi:glycosyltransferase involved in cell wall biosynthesis